MATHVARAGGLGRNLLLAATTSARSAVEDPLTFGVQVARRFPAARGALGRLVHASSLRDREVAETWLAGDGAATQSLLEALAPAGLSRVAAEVAQAAGRPELVVDDARIDPTTRARAGWQLGDASGAIALLESHGRTGRLHRALRAERALMTPGTRLRWQPPATPSSARRRPDCVLHLLTNSLPHTQSGYTVRSHAVLLAQAAAGLAPTAMTRIGYPVVVGVATGRDVDVIDGISYIRALPRSLSRTPDGRLAQQADALLTLALERAPSVLQTTTHHPNAVVVREVARALQLPWAYEVRGMLEQTWVAGLGSDEARARARESERFRLTRAREAELAAAADVVFTLAPSMRDDLTERGVPADRIHLVPNGVDEALLAATAPHAASARAALGLPREGFWVGSTSSLVDYEGFDVLIDAVLRARSSGVDVRLLLVGDGAARPSLRARAATLGDAAVLAGSVPRSTVDAWRAALDVFVVPRVDRDVTRTVAPLKPIEAMAAGVPLLVSDLPPLVDVVGRSLAAEVVVPPGDASALAARILRLAADPTLRTRLIEMGRDRARSRTWTAVGAEYRAALPMVVAR